MQTKKKSKALQTCDTLLSKLMSGELRVKEFIN